MVRRRKFLKFILTRVLTLIIYSGMLSWVYELFVRGEGLFSSSNEAYWMWANTVCVLWWNVMQSPQYVTAFCIHPSWCVFVTVRLPHETDACNGRFFWKGTTSLTTLWRPLWILRTRTVPRSLPTYSPEKTATLCKLLWGYIERRLYSLFNLVTRVQGVMNYPERSVFATVALLEFLSKYRVFEGTSFGLDWSCEVDDDDDYCAPPPFLLLGVCFLWNFCAAFCGPIIRTLSTTLVTPLAGCLTTSQALVSRKSLTAFLCVVDWC